MKRSFKITKSNWAIALCLLGLSFTSHAASLGLVQNIKGNSFLTSKNESLKIAKTGDSIEDFSEVITEEGSSVTIALTHDQLLHISGSTQVRFFNKMLELKRGYVWIQSAKTGGIDNIQTANADFRFTTGEGVYSFDPGKGKSQVLVISGDTTIANINRVENYTVLRDGEFSFVSLDYENGSPRAPTRIGGTSFSKVIALFNGVEPFGPHTYQAPQNAQTTSGRSIASVMDEAPAAPQRAAVKGKIIYIEDNSKEHERVRELELLNYHQKQLVKIATPKTTKKWKPTYEKNSNVKVHIFGAQNESTYSGRAPASVAPASAPSRSPASLGHMAPSIQDDTFKKSLVDEYKKQMRHSKEVNSLIKELESVDQDFSESY